MKVLMGFCNCFVRLVRQALAFESRYVKVTMLDDQHCQLRAHSPAIGKLPFRDSQQCCRIVASTQDDS